MRVFLAILMLMFTTACSAEMLNGNVSKADMLKRNRIIDAKSGQAVAGAQVSIPAKGLSTTTDANGSFGIHAPIDNPTIMSVRKGGYKPYSMTLNSSTLEKPIVIGIEKSAPADIIIEQELLHLGDNSYSESSANAGDFRVAASGSFYSKQFNIPPFDASQEIYFKIGSIIGIDTKMARDLGQSKVTTAYASPPEVYFNNQKIAEIHINGDGQEIILPKGLIRFGGNNEITIKTGRNLFQMARVDYDDIEVMNLSIETR